MSVTLSQTEGLLWYAPLVQSTRWGCTNPETTQWSEKTFRLLHQRYPKSEWAVKTK